MDFLSYTKAMQKKEGPKQFLCQIQDFGGHFHRSTLSTTRDSCRKLRPYKEKLFAPLSALSEQKGPHACKVLELGGGGGANFEFVTSPVEWTVTEPNVKFAPYFQKTVTELGGRHRINDLVEVPYCVHMSMCHRRKKKRKHRLLLPPILLFEECPFLFI